MKFNVALFLTALGMALILESLPWLLAPKKMLAVIRQLLTLPAETMRIWGFALLGGGLLLIWLSR